MDAKKIGGDTGYAGTANRDLCKELGIQTSFVKRGRPSAEKKREEDYVRQELARVRATQMEGSFGTQKEHYAMRRIKARKKKTCRMEHQDTKLTSMRPRQKELNDNP